MVDSKKLISLVEKYEKLIYDTADHIWAHPETGFREWKTSAYMEQHFEELGYTLTKAGNIPGFYTDLDTGKPKSYFNRLHRTVYSVFSVKFTERTGDLV